MTLDGITCQLLANELNKELEGKRVDKIYMPDKHTVILHIRFTGGYQKLLISIDPGAPRICFAENTLDNPSIPPSFCMLLRKYLAGSRIESVTNPGYERIIEITVSKYDELKDRKTYTLIVELMGRFSNLVLINENGRILDSAIHVDFSVSRVREVMPARVYEYPPSQDKYKPEKALEISRSGEIPFMESELQRPVAKALVGSILGLSPVLAAYITDKSDIDDRKTLQMLTDGEKTRLINAIKDFLTSITEGTYTPYLFYGEDGEPEDASIVELKGYAKSKPVSSISEAIDICYLARDSKLVLDKGRDRLSQIIGSALARVIKKREIHEQDLEEGQKADALKHSGDLILTYKYMVKQGSSSVTLIDYASESQSEITIPLNPTLDASGNAQEYYKRFHKAKRKMELAETYLKEDELAAQYLRSLSAAVTAASSVEDLDAINEEIRAEISGDSGFRKSSASVKNSNTNKGDPNKMVGVAKSGKASSRALREAAKRANMNKGNKDKSKERALPCRRYMTSDGYEILAGRNNIQNEQLTFHTVSRRDWWFHVKGLPGTHVILKTKPNEEMPSDNAVLEAASLAAFFSKAIILEEHMTSEDSKPGQLKAEVDYCPVSHVKKIPGAKPGMVIYEGYYSVLVEAKEPSSKDL
ncbi:MAG: NFACT family protein [Clostridiales bacterium]|nr:NFACT family protein [Clostridiales bacterium]